MSDPSFAAEAARLGVDYLGTIFAERSPRRVDVAGAAAVAAAARSAAAAAGRRAAPRIVGVFTSGTVEEIAAVARAVPLDAVQLHGNFSAETAAALKKDGFETWALDGAPSATVADAVLVDGVSPSGVSGGSGRIADWGRVAELKAAGARVILAGGISPENFAEAAATGADVIDVNSSLETAPGVKSVALLRRLAARFGTIVGNGKRQHPGGTRPESLVPAETGDFRRPGGPRQGS